MAKKSENLLVAEINKNFIIQWKNQDEKETQLVSAGKYHTIVGPEMAEKHFKKVLEGGQQNYTFLIRKRLRIKFYSK
jgi:hypothetical protein